MVTFIIFYFVFSALVEFGAALNQGYTTWEDIVRAILLGWLIVPIRLGALLDNYST